MSSYWGDLPQANTGNYGIRFLIEQLGVDALNPPVNTIFRLNDGFRAPQNELLLFRNGLVQDINPPDYAETDARTITMNAGLAALDRLTGLNIVRNTGSGGLIAVDRPPLALGGGVYQTSQNIPNNNEIMVWMNGLLLLPGIHYNKTAANQFTVLIAIPPGAVFVTAIVSAGNQGFNFRETSAAFGAFPAIVPTVNNLEKNIDEILVIINGQLQAENLDYRIQLTQVIVTRVIPGVNDIEVIAIKSCNPSRWMS